MTSENGTGSVGDVTDPGCDHARCRDVRALRT